ncbi:S8 family serine peptidase [Lysobacter cavernae]|uniref:S8 family serine peptidase n=1 Tax=Lysobacter cavernae TaxID=1685901 RepID=A0ABV7RQS3_9GAMM
MKVLTLTMAAAAALLAGQAQAATHVVVAKSLSFSDALASQIEANGGHITARYPGIGVAIVEADAGFRARAQSLIQIRSAVPDVQLQFEIPESVPFDASAQADPPNSGDNDTFFNFQWGMAAIDAREAWDLGYRGNGARVAVLDSGVYCQHFDLASNMLGALNTSFVPGEGPCVTTPGFNHGTHVAGIIAAADNAFGTIGVAPQAKFFAVKVLSEVTGSGSFGGILQGIVYASDNGADVINMSLGVSGGIAQSPDNLELMLAVQRAVNYARGKNTTVIASAGNDATDYDTESNADGTHQIAFPAGLSGVVAISATAPEGWGVDPNTNLDLPASYSNYGKRLVRHAAPGGDFDYTPANQLCVVAGILNPCWAFDMVLSTSFVSGGTQFYSWSAGTSMAAPHAAGVAALIIGKAGGTLSPMQVELRLRVGADDLGPHLQDNFYGHGRVNAYKSVK